MPDRPVVEVDDVHVRFGDVEALRGVSLEIRPGEVYGLLGANGAGKTTLINVLATLLRPASGTARIAGHDVVADADAVRRRIGLAGQFAAVDDYQTGRENVVMVGRLYGLSRRDAEREAADVLERFGLADVADRPSRGYSGGMRRRLDLAASLVGRPVVLYLDEPTTGIDPGNRLDIWELVRDLVAEGTTLLLTTQYLEEADELADRIGVIDHGRLVTEGTADELKDQLGTSTVNLKVRDEDVAATREVVADVEGLREPGNGHFAFPATEGTATMLRLLRRLDERDVEPVHLAVDRPTLDDVFLRITRNPFPDDTGARRSEEVAR